MPTRAHVRERVSVCVRVRALAHVRVYVRASVCICARARVRTQWQHAFYCRVDAAKPERVANLTGLLNGLMMGYDKRLRPGFGGEFAFDSWGEELRREGGERGKGETDRQEDGGTQTEAENVCVCE